MPALAPLLCSACVAPSQSAAPAAPAPVVRYPGVVIHQEVDPLTQLDTYDADELFHLAGEMGRQERYAAARTLYRRLLDDFGPSTLAGAARFNLGLLHERRQDFAAAATLYQGIVGPSAAVAPAFLPEGEAEEQTWLDAHFRLAVCFGKLDDWWKSVAVFDRVLTVEWIDNDDRLEAMTGRGIALQQAGDGEGAEVAFAGVLRFYREAERRGRIADKSLVAEAAFRLGEIAAERYFAVQLSFPMELLGIRLEQKCGRLLAAQRRYIRALRFGDAQTVTIAGLRIGAMYEDLFAAIVGLQTPTELTAEQAEIYREQVRSRVSVLVEKALGVYEKALKIGRSARGEQGNPWLEKLSQGIERLRSLVLKQTTPA